MMVQVPGSRYTPGEQDAAEIGEYTPLPEGRYTVAAVATEIRTSRANIASQYLWLELDVQDGPYAGRKLWHILNVWNASEKAASIGRAQLNDLLEAVGLPDLEDTDQLLARPFRARVAIEPGTEAYPKPSNRIVAVEATDGQAVANRVAPKRDSVPPETSLDDDIPF